MIARNGFRGSTGSSTGKFAGIRSITASLSTDPLVLEPLPSRGSVPVAVAVGVIAAVGVALLL